MQNERSVPDSSYLESLPNDTIKDICKTLDVPALSSLISTSKKVRDICGEVYNSYYIKYRQLLLLIYFFSVDKGAEVSDYIYDLYEPLLYVNPDYSSPKARDNRKRANVHSSFELLIELFKAKYRVNFGKYDMPDNTNPLMDQIHKKAFLLNVLTNYDEYTNTKLVVPITNDDMMVILRPMSNTYIVRFIRRIYGSNFPSDIFQLIADKGFKGYITTLKDPFTGQELPRERNSAFAKQFYKIGNLYDTAILSTKDLIVLLNKYNSPTDIFYLRLSEADRLKLRCFIPNTDFELTTINSVLIDHTNPNDVPEDSGEWYAGHQDIYQVNVVANGEDLKITVEMTVKDGQVESLALYNSSKSPLGDIFIVGMLRPTFPDDFSWDIDQVEAIVMEEHNIYLTGVKWNAVCIIFYRMFQQNPTFIQKSPPDPNTDPQRIDYILVGNIY